LEETQNNIREAIEAFLDISDDRIWPIKTRHKYY
jgi:hypothetical protein